MVSSPTANSERKPGMLRMPLGPRDKKVLGNRSSHPITIGVVILATTFNLILCFLNTQHVLKVTQGTVVAAEAAIYVFAAALSLRNVRIDLLVIGAIFVLYLCGLWLVDEAIGYEFCRDVLIAFLFIALGTSRADQRDGDRAAYTLSALVIIIGLWEWFSLNSFLQTFDIIHYYVNKGFIDSSQIWQKSDVAMNGARGIEGRTLFAFLGPHRMSSIFLEPVSAGNFAVIVFAWFLVRFKSAPLKNSLFMILAAAIIILSDSRAGAFLCLVLAVFSLLPALPRLFVCLIPVLVVAAMAVLGAAHGHMTQVAEGIDQRFAWSGQLLARFHINEWLGIRNPPGAVELNTADSGYAYIMRGIGLPGVAFLWAAFGLWPDATVEGTRYRRLLAIYLALTLCVSPAVFSVKTAALAWFLLGAAQNGVPERRVGVASDRRLASQKPHRAERLPTTIRNWS